MNKLWKQIQKNRLESTIVLVILIFAFLRIWRLNLPGETVFDEVYFPKMAWQYLTHEPFFDIHPPLGKLVIAIGELIFGNTTVGWRIIPLLAGLGIIPAAYFVIKELFNDKRAALLAALLFSIDGLFIVYSRVGLMDGFIMLAGLLALGFGWRFRLQRAAGEKAYKPMLLAGLFAGLAVAVKWIGVGFLPLVAGVCLIKLFTTRKRAISFQDFLVWILSFVVIPAVLYTVPFIANWHSNFWNQFGTWHQQSWGYNVHLNATHPYGSKWYSWPFLIRPIWFYYKGEAGSIVGVDGIGNPLVWWGSTLAVVYTALILGYSLLVWRRANSQIIPREQFWPLLYVFIGWAAFYLPWVGVSRVLFLYHYMSSYLFAMLLAAFWLSKAYDSRGRPVMTAALALAIVVAFWFVPIWVAYPISQGWFDRLMWFRSWI